MLLLVILLLTSSVSNAINLTLLHYDLESRLTPYKEDNENYLETMRADNENELEDFFLLSTNHPTKISFKLSEDPAYKVDALMERWVGNGTEKSTCRFPVFDHESHVTRHVKLRSMPNNIEIFQMMRLYMDPELNTMDIFVVNMTDCQYTKTEILKGYHFFQPGGVFIVLHPWENCHFDVFVLNNKDDCGTFICKRIFDMKDRSLGKATPFALLDDREDWHLTYLSPTAGKGYFSVVRQENKVSLLSLEPNGGLIKAIENNTITKVQFLKISSSYGFFGFCYITESAQNEVHCMQMGETLRASVNITLDLGYPAKFLAVHNLPQGGLVLLSVNCPNAGDNCAEHEITLTRFDADGFNGTFQKFKDEGCMPRKQQQFTFFEEGERICVFYACNVEKEGEIGAYDKIVKSRCF